MPIIKKLYFTLGETAERWQVSRDDLAYLTETGALLTSVRVDDVHLERGVIERECGRKIRAPREQIHFSGLLDLTPKDAGRIIHGKKVHVVQFQAGTEAYAALIEPTRPIRVKPKHLLIRREERDRVEALHGLAGHVVAGGTRFQHSADYKNVRLGTFEMSLGAVQAEVIRRLHEAALTDNPWCAGKSILSECGAASLRMSDVLKSQEHWRQFIRSDGRGRYRLRLSLD